MVEDDFFLKFALDHAPSPIQIEIMHKSSHMLNIINDFLS